MSGSQASTAQYATQRARLLLGCYRTGDANDPETYIAAIAATLARYPEAIVTKVTHPVSGLPSRVMWLPTVKEVRDACEDLAGAEISRIARDRRIREQFAAREQQDQLAERKPTLEDIKAKYGENYGLTPIEPKAKPQPAPSWDAVTAAYQADPARLARLLQAADDQH